MSAIISVADVTDEAEQAQAKADEIAARFAKISADVADVAAFARANPDLAPHLRYASFGHDNIFNVCVSNAAALAAFARAAARAGRTVTKRPMGRDGAYFGIEIGFGSVRMDVFGQRNLVCERVVTGTETVTTEVPDPEALAAVPTVTVTETVEQVEWRCGPLLGAGQTGGER